MKRHLRAHPASPHRLPSSIFACIAALILVALIPATAMAWQRGDMNCDGAVNTADIPLFVQALVATSGVGTCGLDRADMNCNSLIDGRDMQAFVAALLAGPGPCFGGLVWCDGACRNVGLDPSNCGCCGNQCGPGQYCSGGYCWDAEPPP